MSTYTFIDSRKRFRNPVFITLLGLIVFLSTVDLAGSQNKAYSEETNLFAQLASAQNKSGDSLISIQFSNIKIQDALELLAKKINVGFSYNPEIIPDKRINFSMSNVLPHEIIYRLLEGTNLEPVLPPSKDVIVIREKEPVETIEVVIQNISGTVVDAESGEVLPGVNVIAQRPADDSGSAIGTTTNLDGEYAIELPDDITTLAFSYVGYQRLEVVIDGRTEINVELSQDVQMLEEAVVLGYAYQSPSELTGSVSSVSGDEIAEVPATSVSQALQGRVAGVQVVTASGEPGSGSDIVIRGGGSVNGMPPLFIVDGVRMGTDYNFNNQDVESIEILKDASAAAIYGAQAAGGVVLIQTKRGSGQTGVNVSAKAYYGFRESADLIPLMNTQQMFEAREAFGFNTSAWGDPGSLPNTDWNDIMYRTGSDQNYTISLSGATDNSNFYVSGNYFGQEGVRIENSFERYSLRVNSDFDLGEKFKVGETLYIYKSMRDPTAVGNLFRTVPSMAVRDANGDWGKAPDGGYYNGRNPAQDANGRIDEIAETAVEGNIYLDYKFFDGLNLRGTFGASLGSAKDILFEEAYDTGAQSAPAVMDQTYTDWQNYTSNLVLTFDRSFGNHYVNALSGYEVYKEDSSFLFGSAAEFSAERTESFALNSNVGTQRISGGVTPDLRLISQFGRVNYSYANKYMASATVRRDGADRFGPENRWGVFPGFSAGWRVSEESFFENVDFISSLKLRASYGALGNFGSIPQYLYQSSYGPQDISALPDGTRIQVYGRNLSLPNEGIKWEEVKTIDIGFDASFLAGDLLTTVDWYTRNTQDMIYAVPVPLSAGFNGNPVFTNVGELRNTGFEFMVNYRKEYGDFGMDISLNGAYNENEVISLDGTGTQAINAGDGGQYLSNQIARTTAGEPISQFYGYVVEGIFASDAEAENRNVVQPNAGAGDLIYRDVNGDGVITAADRDYIGNPWPKFTYGFNFNFNYKAFDLALQLQGVHDMDVYNATKHYSDFLAGDYNSSPNVFGASFFNGNGVTNQPRLGYFAEDGSYIRDPNANYTKISSYFVEDASYLKLRNIQIGYNLSQEWISALGITSARIYLQAQNVFTITGYSGVDPEVLGEDEGITARGIDHNATYPQTRFTSLGLSIDF